MTRVVLSILLLLCALLIGCSAEPPAPGNQPAQSVPAAADPQAQATPISTEDFEKGRAGSFSEGEGAAQPAGDIPATPAGTN